MKRFLLAIMILVLASSPGLAANFCYVSEFQAQIKNNVQVAMLPVLVDQQITVSASSAQSAAFGASTSMIRVSCDTTVSALAGANPTAGTTNMRIPANVPEYFFVLSGNKIAFITNQ